MENKPRTSNIIDPEFAHSFAIVSGFIDMVGMLGSNVDSLAKETIQGMGIACYYEAEKVQELYREMAGLASTSMNVRFTLPTSSKG